MKKMLLLGLCLWSVLLVKGQLISYEYHYDPAGNRIMCTVVQLNNRGDGESNHEQTLGPLTDMIGNGLTMTLFPNPTKENIRFELSGGNKIGEFVLSDITGRVVAKGRCEDSSLTLELSDQQDGIYLLDIFIDKKPHVYKIIKQ